MRRTLSLLVALVLVEALGAQAPEVGFIRLVNLVAGGGEGPTNFVFDGSDLYKPGYKLGQKTGGMGFKVGSYELGVTKQGCRPANKTIKIEKGQTKTFVAYGSPVRNDEGEIVGWEVKVASLRQKSPERGYLVTLISLCEAEELQVTVEAEGLRAPLKEKVPQKRAHAVKAGRPQGGVKVSVGEVQVAGFHTDDPGNYVVLIYEDEEGKKEAIHYYDPKFLIAG